MSREYIYDEIKKHVGSLMSILLEGGYPPYVVDEVMDSFKRSYKVIFECRNSKDDNPFELRDKVMEMISTSDVEEVKKKAMLKALKEAE